MVCNPTVTISFPATDAEVPGNGLFYTWGSATDAAEVTSYKAELFDSTGALLSATVTALAGVPGFPQRFAFQIYYTGATKTDLKLKVTALKNNVAVGTADEVTGLDIVARYTLT